jgi:hypothetical protein
MNQDSDERGSSGIKILWPITSNAEYKAALAAAAKGKSANNISCVVKYKLNGGVAMLWLGDLEADFMEEICDDLDMRGVDIVFAPHHGRDVLPGKWLDELDPQVIVLGEAPSEHLDYYPDYNTITQNSSGDLTFECVGGKTHIYVSSKTYTVDFLDNEKRKDLYGRYIGTLETAG